MAELDKPIVRGPQSSRPETSRVERETKLAQYWSYEVSESRQASTGSICKPDPGAIQKALTFYKSQGKTIAEVEAIIGGIRIEAKVK
jgi:hypothetical protein